MRRLTRAGLFLGALALLAIPAQSSVSIGTTLFGQGRFRLSGYGGVATAFDQTYTLIGLGAGYFIANGLELGVDGEGWFGNDPNIY